MSYLHFEAKRSGGCLRNTELVLLKCRIPPSTLLDELRQVLVRCSPQVFAGTPSGRSSGPMTTGAEVIALSKKPPVVAFSNPTRTRSVTLSTLVSSATNAAYIRPVPSTREARSSRKPAVASTVSLASVYLISNYNVGK